MDWRNARMGAGVGEGWHELIDGMYGQVLALDPDIAVQQVKEKFGGLRFYYTCSPDLDPKKKDEIYELVRAAEAASFSLCEKCGEPGTTAPGGISGGWLKTLCATHRAEDSVARAEYQKSRT